ncbi:MAG TPA: hypothetical protein VFI45_13660 [Candidatus Acidoferrum sp.]|nr:hypothetical protein [Candidatus Acidoferrum sp.]
MDSRKLAGILMVGLAAAVMVVAVSLPRFPQPADYHDFADHRGWLGIPNFGDVVSNLGFAIVGILGLHALLRKPSRIRFLDSNERWPYLIIFVGLILTAAGSSYYHLAPDNARLVWDRLPMTIVFMSLVAALTAERVSVRAGIALLPVLLAIGVGSVLQWRWSELQGRGDLRFYAAVQLYAMLAVLLALFLKPRYTRVSDLAVLAAFYILAKVTETFDARIFSFGNIVSGHTIKHLAAAVGSYWILRMLQRREPIVE